jgi:hypothetical protein
MPSASHMWRLECSNSTYEIILQVKSVNFHMIDYDPSISHVKKYVNLKFHVGKF